MVDNMVFFLMQENLFEGIVGVCLFMCVFELVVGKWVLCIFLVLENGFVCNNEFLCCVGDGIF